MKIYVCYFSSMWEGCTLPCAAFEKEEDAINWVSSQNDEYADYHEVELL